MFRQFRFRCVKSNFSILEIAVASIPLDQVTGFTEAPVEQMCLGASCDNTSTVLKADGAENEVRA